MLLMRGRGQEVKELEQERVWGHEGFIAKMVAVAFREEGVVENNLPSSIDLTGAIGAEVDQIREAMSTDPDKREGLVWGVFSGGDLSFTRPVFGSEVGVVAAKADSSFIAIHSHPLDWPHSPGDVGKFLYYIEPENRIFEPPWFTWGLGALIVTTPESNYLLIKTEETLPRLRERFGRFGWVEEIDFVSYWERKLGALVADAGQAEGRWPTEIEIRQRLFAFLSSVGDDFGLAFYSSRGLGNVYQLIYG